MQNKLRAFLPVLLLFFILNALFFTAQNFLSQNNIDQNVLVVGNLLLFVITLVSYLIAIRGLKSPNPHAFTRSVFGSILLKLVLCIVAAFAYIAIYKGNLNKPALFACMGLYLIYTFLEVSVLTKLLKGKANG